MPFNRETSRRLLDMLHPGNRFKLMFSFPLDETEPEVIAFRQACHAAASESCPPSAHHSTPTQTSHAISNSIS